MSQAFRIAILDAVPRAYWQDDEGITDGQKFHDLLSQQSAETVLDIFYTTEHEFPNRIEDYDGFVVSGSPASVHDDLDWIRRLSEWIVNADYRGQPVFGSCFGHQLVAKVFGGQVGHNDCGWLIGNYQLQITRSYDWMRPAASSTGLYHFNQERVTRLPDQAVSFADSEVYPDFAYTLGDNILCVQGHPEQPLRAMRNFLGTMDELSQDEYRQARARIDECGRPDAEIWGQWIMQFFLGR